MDFVVLVYVYEGELWVDYFVDYGEVELVVFGDWFLVVYV